VPVMTRGALQVRSIAFIVPLPRFAVSGLRGAVTVRPGGDGCRRRRPEQDTGGEQDQDSADGGTASSVEPGWEWPDPCLQVTSANSVGPSSVRLVIEM
jgi:hypothetical protein